MGHGRCAGLVPSTQEDDIVSVFAWNYHRAAGAALAAKRGETPKTKLKGASREMYKSMSEEELDELATVKRAKLPEHVSDD